jgi:hypothetical protein
LSASTSSTTFDPHSMELPSIGALVGFYHACLGFPVKQTWLNAVKAENCNSFDGLTYSNMSCYCPDADETILGHLAQQRQNVRSTKPKPKTPPAPTPTSKPPPPSDIPSHQVFIKVVPLDMHHRNWAKRAIHTFKSHFLSILAGVDAVFPPYLWDLLLPQAEPTLNLLWQSTLNPGVSAHCEPPQRETPEGIGLSQSFGIGEGTRVG